MGLKERRDGERAEMKRKIMEAATEIIEQEGYEKLSIRKIAAEIEYSPTTIYLYYKDKAEIIDDMSNALYNKVFSGAAAFLSENDARTVEEKTHGILCLCMKELCGEPEMVKAVMFSGRNVIFANDSPNGTPTNPGIDMLDELLSDGVSQKAFRPAVKNSSWMIASALLGFVLCAVANKLYLHDNFGRHVNDFAKMLMDGMKQ